MSDCAQSQQEKQAEEGYGYKLPEPLACIFGEGISFDMDIRLAAEEILELNDHKYDKQDQDTSQNNRRLGKTKEG